MAGRNKSLRAIAAELGCAVNTVRRHLDAPGLPRYAKRRSMRPKLGPFVALLKERLAVNSGRKVPASVLAREIRQMGYEGSDRQVLRFIRELRTRAGDHCANRVDVGAGKRMRVDCIELPRTSSGSLTAFVAMLGWSRASYVEYAPDDSVGALLAFHRRAFEFFGGVPQAVHYGSNHAVFANPNVYGPDRHQFDATFLDFARHYGFVPRLCRPTSAKPNADIERMSRYVRYSFHVTLLARFARCGLELDVDTANVEMRRWLQDVVNARPHGATDMVPASELIVERRSLLPLPSAWRDDAWVRLQVGSMAPPWRLDTALDESAVR